MTDRNDAEALALCERYDVQLDVARKWVTGEVTPPAWVCLEPLEPVTLPADVERVLTDPNVELPGEAELFEHIYDWSNVQANPTITPEPPAKDRKWPR